MYLLLSLEETVEMGFYIIEDDMPLAGFRFSS